MKGEHNDDDQDPLLFCLRRTQKLRKKQENYWIFFTLFSCESSLGRVWKSTFREEVFQNIDFSFENLHRETRLGMPENFSWNKSSFSWQKFTLTPVVSHREIESSSIFLSFFFLWTFPRPKLDFACLHRRKVEDSFPIQEEEKNSREREHCPSHPSTSRVESGCQAHTLHRGMGRECSQASKIKFKNSILPRAMASTAWTGGNPKWKKKKKRTFPFPSPKNHFCQCEERKGRKIQGISVLFFFVSTGWMNSLASRFFFFFLLLRNRKQRKQKRFQEKNWMNFKTFFLGKSFAAFVGSFSWNSRTKSMEKLTFNKISRIFHGFLLL